MATENLHIEQSNVSTASFDVQNRILTVPILDNSVTSDQYDLFMGHEVGHALYTPLDGLKRARDLKMSMSVMNVLEDSRIERKIKLKYPGIRQCFIRAYKELIENDFFGTAGQDLNKMNFIDRVNLYCKAGIDTGIVFSDKEKALLDEIESTLTYDDVMEVYKKVADYMQSRNEEPQESGNEEGKFTYQDRDDYDGDSEEISMQSDEKSDSEKESNTSSKENDDGKTESSGDKQSEDNKSNDEAKDTKENGGSTGDGLKGADSTKPIKETKPPVSETDMAWNENQDRLFSKNAKEIAYGNIPDYELDDYIVGYKELWKRYKKDVLERVSYTTQDKENVGINQKEFNKFRESSKPIVSYLAKEFELRKNAEEMKRVSIAKTGDLNMSKIFSYKYSEDIFKRMAIVPAGKSHGLVMFIDWSGSMANNIDNTIRQLLNLVMFCKKVNVPFEVYAFTQSYYDNDSYKAERKRKGKFGDLALINTFSLMNILSSRMSAIEYKYAASALLAFRERYSVKPDWFMLSGTPLNEAVVAAMKIVPKFQRENKLQIVNTVFLTDGEGSKPYSIFDEYGKIQSFRGKTLVIRDPVSKHEVKISDGSDRKMTAGFIQLLKARTNCNVVGFYIMETRNFSYNAHHFWPELHEKKDYHKIENLKKEFRADKYKIITSEGYDEYYLLKAEGLDMEDDADFEVKENATTRGFVSAFSKFNNNRKANRVVLNRFIGMIA